LSIFWFLCFFAFFISDYFITKSPSKEGLYSKKGGEGERALRSPRKAGLAACLRRKRHQRHESGVFHSSGYHFLVLQTVSVVVLWNYLFVLGNVFFEQTQVFVINKFYLIDTKLTFSIFIRWHMYLV
jgi:hypothetical protein